MFQFWANVCHVKGPLPLHTQDTVTQSCVGQVKTRGGRDIAGPIFPP